MTNSKHVHLYWGGPLLFGPPQCIFLGGSGPPRPPRESTRLDGLQLRHSFSEPKRLDVIMPLQSIEPCRKSMFNSFSGRI